MIARLLTATTIAVCGAAAGYIAASLQQEETQRGSARLPLTTEAPAWDFTGPEDFVSAANPKEDDSPNIPANGKPSADCTKSKKGKPTLAEVLDQLRGLDDAPYGPDTDRKERELVESWSEIDPAASAEYAAKVFALGGKEELLRDAAKAYAKRDPAAAAAWAASLGSPMVRDTALHEIFDAWSQKNPGAAAAAVATLPPGSAQTAAAAPVAGRFAKVDLDGALAWAGSLAGAVQGAALRSILLAQWPKSGPQDPGSALSWILAQNSRSLRDQGLRIVASEWAKRDPATALANAASIADESGRDVFLQSILQSFTRSNPQAAAAWLTSPAAAAYREPMVERVVSGWASFDPASAAQWSSMLGDPVLRTKATAAAARSWAASDPLSASQWISGLADPAARNAGIAAASAALAKSSPAEAARWASAITDQKSRNQSIVRIVDSWKKTDRAAALSFVQAAAFISPNLRQQLLK